MVSSIMKWMLFFVANLVLLAASHASENRTHYEDDVLVSEAEPIVFLTVSSLASKSIPDRLLELNWENLPQDVTERDDVQINLYNKDPQMNASEPLVSVIPTRKGYFRTSIRLPQQHFTINNLTDACLGFWISFLRNGEVQATNCLRAQPTWMHDSRATIGHLSLLDLMLPGTHNTGSYDAYDPNEDTVFNKYLFTQEEDIWNQLVYGIRYLDIRVAYQGHLREKFWITHSSFSLDIPVRYVLQQVRRFLDATQEVVIMDFHRFVTGFQNKRSSSPRRRHRELIAMLEEELGQYLVPVQLTSGVTLNQLWESGRRLYVGYADERSRSRSVYLFPAIRHLWGDVDDVDDLKSYLNETVCKPERPRITSAMVHLTPTTYGVLFNSYGGLRKMADEVNRQVNKWFRYEWNHCANIVATDFFLGNNVIELAIRTNKNRALDSSSFIHGLL